MSGKTTCSDTIEMLGIYGNIDLGCDPVDITELRCDSDLDPACSTNLFTGTSYPYGTFTGTFEICL
jgi:hypothetical protein